MSPKQATSKRIKRILKRFFLIVFSLLIMINLAILITGKTYLYKGIQATYLKGKSGPGIYDSLIFKNSEIRRGTSFQKWQEGNLKSLKEEHISALEALNTTSFLVIQNEEIIYENYWGDHTKQTRSNSFSAAKSIVGLLIGIAIDQGDINSFDTPVNDYLMFVDDDSLTIRHLLKMSSGLIWRESGSNPLSENAAAYYGSDLNTFMRRSKFDGTQNTMFEYKSGNSQLLGMLLEKATGMSIASYMEKMVWQKLGTEKDAFWSLDQADGIAKTFCCYYATTRDYARLGQLVNQQGVWRGDTIISPEIMNELTDFAVLKDGSIISNYGLHYWLLDQPDRKVVYARGILGQYIISIPSLDIVVVRTGHEREDKFENLTGDEAYKNNHPKDLFLYLSIVEDLIAE